MARLSGGTASPIGKGAYPALTDPRKDSRAPAPLTLRLGAARHQPVPPPVALPGPAAGPVQLRPAAGPLLGRSDQTVRQRLREFYREAGAKRGRGRSQIDPAACAGGLLGWILTGWPSRRLALALDPTTLADRLTVLCASVVYRGCALPVAWTVLPGNAPGAWLPHWADLLGRLGRAPGPGWTVAVLTDRGLESAGLFRAIAALGWHPLMRVKGPGTFRPAGWRRFHPMGRLARPGGRWHAAGEAYTRATARLARTLLARWDAGQAEPWLLLTDLPPAAADPAWYAWRGWIEQGFKIAKSAGWQWQRSRMADPARAARLWLVVAVATLYLVEVGGAAEGGPVHETLPRLRAHRVFRRGAALVLAALVGGRPLPRGQFRPDDWPAPHHEPLRLTEPEFLSQVNTSP